MREEDRISPTIYLEGLYAEYQDGIPNGTAGRENNTFYEDQMPDTDLNMDFFQDFEQVKDRIFISW